MTTALIRDHWWWRPGWREGRSAYTWHITRDLHPAIDPLATAYQPVLAPLGTLDVIPLQWLHLTMQGLGFTDEVTPQDVGQIVQAASVRLAILDPVTFTVGPAEVGSEGCTLHARPPEPLVRLRDQLRAAIAEVWGAERVPEAAGYHPHVSLAYNNSDTSAQPLAERLSRHPVGPVTITAESVQLIDLNRDGRMYTWATVATVPLGNAKSTE